VDGEAFNAGLENHTVKQLAELVRDTLEDPGIAIEFLPSDDPRSYHINSDKIRRQLGFTPQYTIEDAVRELGHAYRAGWLTDPLQNPAYYNIRTMQRLGGAVRCA
jgi:nucleoside-diphosphate-sugar epimerase